MEKEEHLIVTAPVGDPDIFLSHSMGQDEPVDPMGGPLKISIQAVEEEQPEEHPDTLDSDVASSFMKKIPEMTKRIDPSTEEPQAPVPILDASLVLDSNQPPISDKYSPENTEPAGFPAVEQSEQELDETEVKCDDTKNNQKTKTSQSKPPPLRVNTSVNNQEQTCENEELPLPKGAYKFDLNQMDEDFNPFTSGGSKIPNSPPPCGSGSVPIVEHLHTDISSAAPAEEEEVKESQSNPKPVMLEFGLDEGAASKPPPKKLASKKTTSKVAAKKQKAKASEALSKAAAELTTSETVPQPASEPATDPLPEPALPETDIPVPLNLDDVPIPKTGAYNFDPSKWDDPDFNPFGSNSKVSSSPVLPKASYTFDPDNLDDSLDPFKPSRSLSTDESTSKLPEKKVPDKGQQKAEKKVRQIPRKSKERTVA